MLQPVFEYDPSKTPVESGFVQAQTSAIIVGGAQEAIAPSAMASVSGSDWQSPL
jgi:hypothetical protein